MGRFYNSTAGQFVDDNIYKAPWELMQSALGAQEARAQSLVDKTELIEGAVDNVNHLNFDAENQRVKEIQNKYQKEVDALTTEINNNPKSYLELMPKIKALQKQIVEDRTSGDWYQVEQRHADYNAWLKANEKQKEESPELFNRLDALWRQDIEERATLDPTARFKGQQVVNKPNLIEKYQKYFNDIKDSATEYKNGKYLINNKEVTKDEVARIAWNTLRADKDYAGYINQMGNILGDEGYFNNGTEVGAFIVLGPDGKKITTEAEFNALSDEDKAKVTQVLNPDNPFYNELSSVADTYSFSKTSVKADEFEKINAKAGVDSKLEGQRAANRAALQAARIEGDKQKIALKFEMQAANDRAKWKREMQESGEGGNEEDLEILNEITAKETVGSIRNAQDVKYTSDYQLLVGTSKTSPYDGAIGDFNAEPGSEQYGAKQRLLNARAHANKALKASTVTLSNGTQVTAEQYDKWLGGRRPSEELAKQFLAEARGVIIDIEKDDVSDMGGAATGASAGGVAVLDWVAEAVYDASEEARWTPGFTKTDTANDWDKIDELGEKMTEKQEEYYVNYRTKPVTANFAPIIDTESRGFIIDEIKLNEEDFYFADELGNTMSDEDRTTLVTDLKHEDHVFATASNSHNEMGLRIVKDGKSYYAFPERKDAGATNTVISIAMDGVDPGSQFFKDMVNRESSSLIHNIKRAGLNKNETYSRLVKYEGIEMNLEIDNSGSVNMRLPQDGLEGEVQKKFTTMTEFVNYIKSLKKK